MRRSSDALRAAEPIAAGRLVELFPQVRVPAGRGYDLVYRPGEDESPHIAALRGWLHDEVRAFLTATGQDVPSAVSA